MKIDRHRGPVAQLGARFHGMEEVESSNLSRSTKTSRTYGLAVGIPINLSNILRSLAFPGNPAFWIP
jgi:hypothetical protein